MEISYAKDHRKLSIEDLKIGIIFKIVMKDGLESSNNVYMTTTLIMNETDDIVNAVDLTSGELIGFALNTEVNVYAGMLHLEAVV